MKKLGLFFLGIGTLVAVGLSSSAYASTGYQEQQNQEVCQPVACYGDSTVNQVPCTNNLPCTTNVPCNTDTVCAPAPCFTGC